MSKTGKYMIVDSKTKRKFLVEPIDNSGRMADWGLYNDQKKYTGSIKESESTISEENNFTNIAVLPPGHNPMDYVDNLLKEDKNMQEYKNMTTLLRGVYSKMLEDNVPDAALYEVEFGLLDYYSKNELDYEKNFNYVLDLSKRILERIKKNKWKASRKETNNLIDRWLTNMEAEGQLTICDRLDYLRLLGVRQ